MNIAFYERFARFQEDALQRGAIRVSPTPEEIRKMPNLLAELNERVIAMERELEKRAPTKDSQVYVELEDRIASLNAALTEVKDQLKTVEDVHTALVERIAELEKTENSDGK